MRTRGRIDRNQPEIVKALRKAGASVISLADQGNGCPDLLVGFGYRNYLLEVKDPLQPPSKRRLTEDEEIWHKAWWGQVQVVETAEQALKLLGEWEARACEVGEGGQQ